MRAQAGHIVNFACAYFSMERLEIDIQPIGHKRIDGKLSKPVMHQPSALGPVVEDKLDRFPWGGRRSLTLAIDDSHRQVKCRVVDSNGQILGELTALIQSKGCLANPKKVANSE